MSDAPRSELFLSCDLVGSTAYKQRPGSDWVEVFLAFYRQFPQRLGDILAEEAETPPRFELWKPIGDELIFKVLINNEADVTRAVRLWLRALDGYAAEKALEQEGLGTKGGAFIGTFPGPDVEATVVRDPGDEKSDAAPVVLNDRALARRDHAAYVYDYFGPSFDTGFRVNAHATKRYFTLAVEVTWAMLLAEYHSPAASPLEDLRLLGLEELKGVWGGRDYPLFAIDRAFNDPVNQLVGQLTNATKPDLRTARDLCAACVESDGWPGKLFLPGAADGALRAAPPDVLADLRDNEMRGAESKPSAAEERRGKNVRPATLPVGAPTRTLLHASEVADRLGLTWTAFERMYQRGEAPRPLLHDAPLEVNRWRASAVEAWLAAHPVDSLAPSPRRPRPRRPPDVSP